MMQFSNLLLAAPKYFYHQIEGFIGCFFSLRSKIFYHRIERIEQIFSFRWRKGIRVIRVI